jgi:hypothetical protein
MVFQAVTVKPAPGRTRPAYGLTTVILLYLGVAAAQAFSPELPSVVIGVRGLRLIAEPLVLFFIGSEVARRPQLRRQVIRMIVITGVIVIAYAGKQWLFGFDHAERAYLRHTFPIAVRERRLTSTMFGATALGIYMSLLAFVALSRVVRQRRGAIRWGLLATAAMFVLFLTGQRGVLLAGLTGGAAIVAVAVLRPGTRGPAARVGEALTVVVALALAVAITTPLQDRRQASAQGQTALDAARIKLALLKSGSQETSYQLRSSRLQQVGDALSTAPLGVGTGLNLLLDPSRSARATLLGDAGFGGAEYRSRLQPIPGELYYYNLASETGLPGLALWCALALFGIVTAGGVALRHPDREKATFALVAMGFLIVVVVDSFTVDAMTTIQVSGWFWLVLGVVGRWGQEDRATERVPARTLN